MLSVGERVEINDHDLEIYDFGEIKHIIKGELLPYQILCDHGDEDGHRTLRFAVGSIKALEEQKPVETKIEGLKVVEVVQAKQTFKIGEQYYSKLREKGTHYTLYNSKMVCRGVMPVDMFKNTSLNRLSIRSKDIQKENKANVPKEVKARNRHREAAKTTYEEMELLGQVNIFEILEG